MITARLLMRRFASLRREDGSTLLLALIVLAAFSISAAGLIQFARANEWSTGRERQATRAFSIAESGLHYAFVAIANKDPYDAAAVSTTIASTSVSVDGGTATYSATKTAMSTWTVSSTGVSPNGAVTRQLQQQLKSSPTMSNAWNLGFAMFNTSGCATESGGTSKITVSAYFQSDFCPSGGAGIAQPTGTSGTLTVYVGGQFKPNVSTSTIGVSGTPVASVVVGGYGGTLPGCPNATGGSCSAANAGIYTNSLATSGTAVTKPTVNADTIYGLANWNTPTCTTGSFVFDGNTTRNSSISSASIVSSSTFDCTVTDSSGRTIGRLAWNSTTKAMTISGIVFIDTAKLTFGSDATYTGKGTLYINGTITISSSVLCGPPATIVSGACSGSWNPDTGNLTLVALNSANASSNVIVMSGGSQVDASGYANGPVTMSGGTVLSGPVIADGGVVSGGSRSISPYSQPASSPGTTPAYAPVRGSWRQIQ